MSGYVVKVHDCAPPRGRAQNPEGTIWRCDCGQCFVVRRRLWDSYPKWHYISAKKVTKIMKKLGASGSPVKDGDE